MQCLWNINALKWDLSQTHTTHGRFVAISWPGIPGGQAGCFACIIVGNTFSKNNCSRVMVSAYTNSYGIQIGDWFWEWEMSSISKPWYTIWSPYIKRYKHDHHSCPNINQKAMQLSALSDHQKDLEIRDMH